MLSADIRRALMQIKLLSETDDLTGALNMRAFNMVSERIFRHSTRYSHPFSVLMIDSDSLKSVNDTHGHEAGNRLLKMITQCIQGQLRDTDYVARYGGDEFVVLLPETPCSGAAGVATRIRQQIESAHTRNAHGTGPHDHQHRHRLLSRPWQQSRYHPGKSRSRDVCQQDRRQKPHHGVRRHIGGSAVTPELRHAARPEILHVVVIRFAPVVRAPAGHAENGHRRKIARRVQCSGIEQPLREHGVEPFKLHGERSREKIRDQPGTACRGP